MADFVVGIVVNVLRKVIVNCRKRGSVGGVAAPSRNFPVLNSPEFVVLNPEISFEDFGCGRKVMPCALL
jgi:hypothetical protein